MIYKIFSIYDSKLEAYSQPFYAQALGAALRSFQDAITKPDSHLAKYSEDFTLFELGSFDDSTGAFSSLTAPINRGKAIDFKVV